MKVERLVSSLQIAGSKIKKMLDWNPPPFTLEEGIRKTVQWYIKK
jgi:dTDP-D-glucose 4,6-dehydratase